MSPGEGVDEEGDDGGGEDGAGEVDARQDVEAGLAHGELVALLALLRGRLVGRRGRAVVGAAEGQVLLGDDRWLAVQDCKKAFAKTCETAQSIVM